MLDPAQDRPAVRMRRRPTARQAGRAALDTLIGRMERAAGLPIPLKAAVVRRNEANAIALPGGHIYVFEGLIAQAKTPDELAGVIAHEIGHVAHRDGTRSILQAAGLSFLFGMLLGDFTGGGVVVLAAQTDHAVGLFARGRERGRPLRRRADRQASAATAARSAPSSTASPARSSPA